MSTRRLWILLKNLPGDSAFKTAHPEGNWTLEAEVTTGAWNEIKAMRGDLWAFLRNEALPFHPVLSPSARRQQEAKRQQMRAMHDEIVAQAGGPVRG